MATTRYDGFVNYGDDDASILYSHPLTSLPAGATKGGAGAANINFDSILGVQLSNTGSLLLPALTAAQQALLDRAGQISFEVEAGWFQSTYQGTGGNEYLCLFKDGGSNSFGVEKPINSANVFSVNNGSGLGQKGVLSHLSASKGTHCLVTYSWNNNEISVYKDYLLVMKNTWTTHVAGMLANIYIGGTASGAFNSISTYHIRNICISSRPVIRPTDPALRDTIILGHSYTVNGDYPNADLAIIGSSASASYQDSGFIPQVHRHLSQRGRHFGFGRMTSYGIAGTKIASGANNCTTQITTAIAANHRAPSVCILYTGINDVVGNSITSQFQTDFQTVIGTNLIPLNASMKILVCTMLNPTGYVSWTTTQADIDQGNLYIKGLAVTYPSNVRIVDTFNVLGGWTNKSSADFITDNLHPSKIGYLKIANAIGSVLYGWI